MLAKALLITSRENLTGLAFSHRYPAAEPRPGRATPDTAEELGPPGAGPRLQRRFPRRLGLRATYGTKLSRLIRSGSPAQHLNTLLGFTAS